MTERPAPHKRSQEPQLQLTPEQRRDYLLKLPVSHLPEYVVVEGADEQLVNSMYINWQHLGSASAPEGSYNIYWNPANGDVCKIRRKLGRLPTNQLFS